MGYIKFMTLGDLRREVCQVKIDFRGGGKGEMVHPLELVYQLRVVVQGLLTH
jgi:hypothetical protein